MKRLVVLAALGLAGCVTPPPKPIVDLKTVSDPAAYQRDLIECASLADYYFKSESNATVAAATGAAIGGAGAAAAVVLAGPTISPTFDIGTGLVGGFVAGAYADQRDQERDRNLGAGRCLQGRGYTIVNEKEVYLTPERWCAWTLIRTNSLPSTGGREKVLECAAHEEARRAQLK